MAVTAAEDGTIVLWKIQDKEGRTLKRDKETTYAEEILITKSDLEEKNQVMNELRNRVNELKTENEYQMRLKEMSHSDKMKELTERCVIIHILYITDLKQYDEYLIIIILLCFFFFWNWDN